MLKEYTLSLLKKHPKNYREHPEEQLSHLMDSIKTNGVYRNVVVSQDDYILAGHGVVQACLKLGIEKVLIYRVPYNHDTPQALKVLVGDNEIEHLAEQDDRLLSELLKQIRESEANLIGTGFDDMMLANLLMVTRPATEIKNFDEAAEWVGMPDYENASEPIKLVINFETPELRDEFIALKEIQIGKKVNGKTFSTWYPYREKDDLKSVAFERKENL